jgi:MFS family permease
MFLGYILAGFFLLILGKDLTIAFLALLFFVSAFFILPIKAQYQIRDPKSKDTETSFFRELHEILPFIKKTKKVVQALVVLTIAQAIIFMFAVLGPGYVSTILNIAVERLSLILIAPASLGLVVGAILLGSIGKNFKFKWLSAVGFMLSGIIFVLFSHGAKLASTLPVIIVLSILIGFAVSLIFIPGHATLQTETSERLRGRIYGLLNALTGVVSFLPVVLAGGLADIIGVGTVVSGVGFIMLMISIFFFVLV